MAKKAERGVVYKITSKAKPDRIYVGSSVYLQNRKTLHIRNLQDNKHHSVLLQRHVNKYGLADIDFEVLESVDDNSLLLEVEQKYLDTLNPYFNVAKIAGSCLGVRQRPETIRKRAESKRGIPRSPETKHKISEALTGKPLHPDHIESMRMGLKGKKQSASTKAKRSQSLKGRQFSEETIAKMREARAKREPITETTRIKMSESAKARKKATRGTYRKKSIQDGRFKCVNSLSLIQLFDTLNKSGTTTEQIGKDYGLNGSTVRRYLRQYRTGKFEKE